MTKGKTINLSESQRELLFNNMILLELFVIKLHEVSREVYGPQFWDVAIKAFTLTELTLYKNYPYSVDFVHEVDLAFEELTNILYQGAENDLFS